jgi:subtilisin family serine protease
VPAAEAGSRQVFIEVTNASGLAWLRAPEQQTWITNVVQVVDGYCTATVAVNRLSELQARPDVLEVEGVRHVRSHLDHSVPSIHGWDDVPMPNERQAQGAGVVIGIVDYGLDFRLADFCLAGNPKRTRIAYLWDQELKPWGAEKPQPTYGYGVEYTWKDIDRVLEEDPGAVVRHNPLHWEDNISGHGTHVAGIAAGNGETYDGKFPGGQYLGVAPGATLVFVHLPRKDVLDQVNRANGTLANSVNLAHAIAYCFEKARELNMPCVVNLSMGFNGGGHDGNMAVERIIDQLLSTPGRAVVIAAGNEHARHKRVHYGNWLAQGDSKDIRWDTGYLQRAPNGQFFWGDPTANEVEIWYSNRSRIEVQLVAPDDGETTPWIRPDTDAEYRFARGETAIINSDAETPWKGAACIYIRLEPSGGGRKWIRCGRWIIRVRALEVAASEPAEGVRFDAWIERTIPDPGEGDRDLWSRFADYDRDSAITLTTPSTARCAITVASCDNSEVPNISEFSSQGRTRDQREKPEITAPGEQVFSSNAGAGLGDPVVPARQAMGGTSMAAPHITGIVARLLARRPNLGCEEIRELLVKSASLPNGVAGPWHRQWGHGRVNVAEAMRLLEQGHP